LISKLEDFDSEIKYCTRYQNPKQTENFNVETLWHQYQNKPLTSVLTFDKIPDAAQKINLFKKEKIGLSKKRIQLIFNKSDGLELTDWQYSKPPYLVF
jgi:hypothetical protein